MMTSLYPSDYSKLTEMPDILDLSGITTMYQMFKSCYALKFIQGFDTSLITNMEWLFYNCKALTLVPEMDTSKVTTMKKMFYNCYELTDIPWAIDLSSIFNIEDMQDMFTGCPVQSVRFKNVPEELKDSLTNEALNLSSTAVITIESLLERKTITLTNKFYKMSDVYPDAYKSMKKVPDKLDMSQLTTMYCMFQGCLELTELPELNTTNITTMERAFYNCPKITVWPESIYTENVSNMSWLFDLCRGMTVMPVINTSKAPDFSRFCYNASGLQSIPFAIDLSAVKKIGNMGSMFNGCPVKEVRFKNVPAALVNSLTNTNLSLNENTPIIIENVLQ